MDPIQTLIDLAIAEDIGIGDVTTDAVFGAESPQGTARIYAKQDLILAGTEVMCRVLATVDQDLDCQCLHVDGALLDNDDDIARISGSVASLLKAERIALNFLQRLSGVATYTAQFVADVKGLGVVIRDTRKTTPGWRALEKQATKAGGAENHRMGLYDQYLVKDNHIAAAGGIRQCLQAINAARQDDSLKVQVEVQNLQQAMEAVEEGADSLLLDNMTMGTVEKVAKRLRDQVELEVSGGVTLVDVEHWAKTGVHAISIGALTHSAPAVDIAMALTVSGSPEH